MTIELNVGDAFRYEVLRRRPESGRAWLDELPTLCGELCRRWRLTIDGPSSAGGTSLVVPVIGPSGRAALKLIGPVIDAADECGALEAYCGDGAVRIFDADLTANALLIEWLPGPSLLTEPDRVEAFRIAGGLAGRLGRTPAPVGTRSLASGTDPWRDQLLAQHAEADRTGSAFPDDLFALALRAVDELAEDPTETLTHGDLSLDNILSAGPGRWVAIDPLLLAGTAAHEAHTIVRSHLADVVSASDPLARLDSWTREATRAAEVDHAWAQRLSLARYVASAYWEGQNGGDPDNVRRLRAATTLTARLVIKS